MANIIMNNKLHTALLLTNKYGKPDDQYVDNINRVLKDIGDHHYHILQNFYEQSIKQQKDAAESGLRLAIALYKEIDRMEESGSFIDDDVYVGWQAKSWRKRVQERIESAGFSRQYAYKLAVAGQWEYKLTLGTSQRWLNSLTPSHKYELALMSEDAFESVIKQVAHPQFPLSNKGLPWQQWDDISVRSLEGIRKRYESFKESEKARAALREVHVEVLNNDPNPEVIEDTIEPTQYELAEELVSIVNRIDTQAGWKDPKLIEILSLEKDALMNVAHIATLPVNKPITV